MTDESLDREAVARIIYRAMLGSGDDFTRTPEEWADEILRLIALARTSDQARIAQLEKALAKFTLFRNLDEEIVHYAGLCIKAAEENGRELLHEDLCRWSVVFGRGSDLRDDRDRRINERLKAMIALALARTSVGEGWRPIESAPRDGTPILACSVNHDAREVVCWQDGLDSGSFENLIADEPEPEKGWVNNGPIKDRFYANPRWFTHWQSLPAPPATSDAP